MVLFTLILYFRIGAKYCNKSLSGCVSVCLSVCLSFCFHISEATRSATKADFLSMLTVVVDRSSVFWWRCDTLSVSGFAANVTFSHNGPTACSNYALASRNSRNCFIDSSRYNSTVKTTGDQVCYLRLSCCCCCCCCCS